MKHIGSVTFEENFSSFFLSVFFLFWINSNFVSVYIFFLSIETQLLLGLNWWVCYLNLYRSRFTIYIYVYTHCVLTDWLVFCFVNVFVLWICATTENQPNGSVHFDQQNISVLNKMSGKIRNLYVPSVFVYDGGRSIYVLSRRIQCFPCMRAMSACLSCTKQHGRRRRRRRQQRRRRRYSGIHTPGFGVAVCAVWSPRARPLLLLWVKCALAYVYACAIHICVTLTMLNIDFFFCSSLSHFGSFVCRFVNARRRRFALFSMYLCNIYLSGFRFAPALSILSTLPYSRPRDRQRERESARGVHTENEFRTRQCQCSALASNSFVCATNTRLLSCSSPDDFYTNTSKVRVPL